MVPTSAAQRFQAAGAQCILVAEFCMFPHNSKGKILHTLRNEFNGKIRLKQLFQPNLFFYGE